MKVAIAFSMISMWFSGAWWEGERKASTLAFIFAMLILAVGALSGCSAGTALYHACREGLCR